MRLVDFAFSSEQSGRRCRLASMKSHLLSTVVVLSLFCLGTFDHVPKGKRVAIKIEKFSPTRFGFDVLVSLKNTGTEPLILGEGGWKTGALQSLDIQQWDDKLGWQSVGPCHDVAPVSTVKLSPSESIQNVIPIGDRAHGFANSVCPRKIEHLGSKVRAILYFAYQSQEQFEARDQKGRVDFVSTPVQLPVGN